MKKLLALALTLALALSLLAGCGGSPAASPSASGDAAASSGASEAPAGENVIKIGVFEPSTGDSGPGGKQEMLGMQYANYETPTVEIGGTNRLVIEDGTARMEWADCPDQICVNHRPVSSGGESIICLPNKVVVSVVSSKESSLDGIAQ